MIGLFCRISSLLQASFAKETYNFKEPTNRSHPIVVISGSLAAAKYTLLCVVCCVLCVVCCVWCKGEPN